MLSVKNVQLEAHHVFDGSSKEIIVRRLNHSSLLEFHSDKLEVSRHDYVRANVTEMKKMLATIREGSLYNINHHDIHHYSVTYILVVLFVMYAIYMITPLSNLITFEFGFILIIVYINGYKLG